MSPKKFPISVLLVACVGLVMFVDTEQKPTNALTVATWSDDSSGADTVAATTIATGSRYDSNSSLEVDASEDGTVLGAVWLERTGSGRGHIRGAVGWTDGAVIKWSASTLLNASVTESANHRSMSVSGDGRTIYATWVEASGDPTLLDEIRYAIGAITINPSTNTPSVTWGATQTRSKASHQWYPTIDSNFDGTKVVLTYWSSTASMSAPYEYLADVATVAISGTTRTPTWKGPATITVPTISYTTSRPNLQVKVSRDGSRAIAAWWDGNGLNSGYGRIRASVADLAPSFPSSLSGSAWSPAVTLSTANEAKAKLNTTMASLDFNDAGTRAVVAWKGDSGSNEYVSARVATLSNATTVTWSPEVKVVTGLSVEAQQTRASISADGSRVFVAWGTGANLASTNGSHGAVVGMVATSGTPTWSNAVTVQSGAGVGGNFGAAMSRDGTTAVMMPITYVSGTTRAMAYASTIWEQGGLLQTDWEAQGTLLSDSNSAPEWDLTSAGILLAKNGSLALAHWNKLNSLDLTTSMFSRVTTIGGPLPSTVVPTLGAAAGGTNITIGGTGFRPGATVTVGGVVCTNVVVVSSSSITCTTGAGTAGAADVVVTNPNNAAGTLSGSFTISPPASSPTQAPTSPSTSAAEPATTTIPTGVTPGAIVTTTVPNTANLSSVTTLAPGLSSPGRKLTTPSSRPDSSGDDASTNGGGSVMPSAIPAIEVIESLSLADLIVDVNGDPVSGTVAPGDEIFVKGMGFQPSEAVSVLMGTTAFVRIATISAGTNGVVSASVVVPAMVTGTQTLALFGEKSGHGMRTTLTIEPAELRQASPVLVKDVDSTGSTSRWWIAVGLVAGFGAIVWFFLVFKRRKDDEEEEEGMNLTPPNS